MSAERNGRRREVARGIAPGQKKWRAWRHTEWFCSQAKAHRLLTREGILGRRAYASSRARSQTFASGTIRARVGTLV